MSEHRIAVAAFKGRIQTTHCTVEETLDFGRATQKAPPTVPHGRNFFGPDRILGETGARTALPFFRIPPTSFHLSRVLESRRRSPAIAAAFSLFSAAGIHQGAGDSRTLFRQRHCYSCRQADCFGLRRILPERRHRWSCQARTTERSERPWRPDRNGLRVLHAADGG